MSFPENVFTVRPPILEPLAGTLPEPEMHTRLIREAGLLPDEKLEPLRAAAAQGLDAFAVAFNSMASTDPEFAGLAPVVLYETLGRSLPDGMAGAAVLWFSAQRCALKNAKAMSAAGFTGEAHEMGNQFFQAMIERGVDGVTYTKHDYEESWDLLRTADQKINMEMPELIADLAKLSELPTTHASDDFPFILSAGERRAFTTNANMRDPEWRKKDKEGALRMSPADAAKVGVEDGSRVRITTAGGSQVAVVEVNNTYRDGHVALPNGHGLEYAPGGGNPEVYGVSTNELTSIGWKDAYAGTPWHKHVPARLEPV
ncbi:MAG: anaerobic selenocysteine-containing dehydrogenase [Acidimicrobiales bacterium]|jgi:anaerobic selenocysteine-containing dehydrogenase